MKVIFTQFMKGNATGEIEILRNTPNIEIIRPVQPYPFFHEMTEKEKEKLYQEHEEILDKIMESLKKQDKIMVIMDELTYPIRWNLINKEKVKALLEEEEIEFIITGRDPEKFLIEKADYITEMVKIKHPFDKGVEARRGIEF